ncbi:MAG: tRNA uridine-5-carboxymethylaminomethyl(34) synthesis GTPase MnmE [Candidatus Omnitrophota bacterium]
MMDIANKDTIAAISTPMGEGGIGIVRMSGRDAIRLAERIFVPVKDSRISSSASHTVHYGHIKPPGKEEIVDEVLLTVLRSPNTYTTEDMVEVNCHGGVMPLKKVLELCISEGARLAEPGEFTRRAFLSGRIDLTQAEAVLDIIKSKTDTSRRVAVEQLRGTFSEEIMNLRSSIIEVLSQIELTIDFSQEAVEFPEVDQITKKVKDIHTSVLRVLETSDKGMILRDGASVVICGKPNVGKSSLMNALLKHDRVIVTPVAGTTRDVIEESINLSGVRVRISDTAGIIETQDRVEIEGIKRSREKLENADTVLFMVDSSRTLSEKDKEIYQTIKGDRTIIVANKTDLPRKLDLKKVKELFAQDEVLEVSALKKEGLESLEDAVANKLFKGDVGMPEGPVVTNARHKEVLMNAAGSLERAASVTGDKYNGELLASDLNEAVRQLGIVTGQTATDDILDKIFSQFCIGK